MPGKSRFASKSGLQGGIISQARVDFDQPMRSGQQAHKGVIELVRRRMLDGLLPNLHLLTDRAEETLADATSLRWRPEKPPG